MRNWEEMGIVWSTETVNGDGAGAAQIPIPQSLDKVRAAFGDAAILGTLDGTSWRVAAQDVARRWNQRNIAAPVAVRLQKADAIAEAQREAVYNRLIGVKMVQRAAAVTITVKVHTYSLPDGTEFTPDVTQDKEQQLTALRAAWVAAMIDLDTGLEAEQLIEMANTKVNLKGE